MQKDAQMNGVYRIVFWIVTGTICATFAVVAGGYVNQEIALYRIRSRFAEMDKTTSRRRDDESKKVQTQALSVLHRHGYIDVSDDTTAFDSMTPGVDKMVSGKAKHKGGAMHDFRIGFRVGKFGISERWEVVTLDVNGEKKK